MATEVPLQSSGQSGTGLRAGAIGLGVEGPHGPRGGERLEAMGCEHSADIAGQVHRPDDRLVELTLPE